MRNSIRPSIVAGAFALLAACSPSSESAPLTEDLRQDLAKAGASDVELAGVPANRVDFVSSAEQSSAAPAPRSPLVARAPSAVRGRRAAVASARREAPAAAAPAPRAEPTPAVVVSEEMRPEPTAAQGRPRAPLPSTQREPPGGWRSTGEVIRNAPFPIKP